MELSNFEFPFNTKCFVPCPIETVWKVLYSIEDVVNGKYIGKHINKRLTSDDQRCSIDNYNINSNATFNLFEAT